MRVVIRSLIVCAGVAWAGVAPAAPKRPVPAAPKVSAAAKYREAVAQHGSGNYQAALELIEQGLAVAPKDLSLLGLKGTVLLELRDYRGALAAYQAYLAAGVRGANQREAQRIVEKLLAVESTFLEITLANGPADVYLDSKTLGVFCRAAPACNQPVLPGEYKVIAERPGFERAAKDVTVKNGETTKVALALTEKPSALVLRVSPGDARVTVDGAAHDPALPIKAGKHVVVASLAGHGEVRREIEAREGKPVELEISLAPIVPARVEPPGAELVLDGQPVKLQDGGVPIPPGAHELVIRAKGFGDRRIEIPADRGADYKLAVKLEPAVAEGRSPSGTGGGLTARRKLALVAGGAGLVAVGVGAALGLSAGGLEEDAYARCADPSSPCPDAHEANTLIHRGQQRALQANIAYGVAGGAAIAAAVLWLTGAPESRVAVTPRLGATAGLDVAVRF